MFKLLLFLTALFLICQLSAGKIAISEERNTIRLMRKDGQWVPAPPTAPRTAPPPSNYMDKEASRRLFEQDQIMAGEYGVPPSISMPGDEEDLSEPLIFELPEEQILSGCTYARGYSFPTICTDNNQNLIFRAGRDPQSMLDSIKVAQGKNGQYNIVPQGYTGELVKDDAEDIRKGLIAPIDPNDDISKRMRDFEESQGQRK